MTNLGDLEIFVAVATTGSMSAAGRSLGLAPAMISKRIKRLEDRLGTRLLQRTTRQISLTEAGQGFFDRIRVVMAGMDEAEAFVTGRSQLAQGTLKISAPTSFGRMHIAPHLKPFMAANPELTVNLVLSDRFIDLVGEGYDLAIRIGDLSDTSLVAKKLAPVSRVLCASPSYLAERGMPQTLADLAQHVCLSHDNSQWQLEGPTGSTTVRVESRLVTNSSEVIREAVIAGLGIALRSTWDVGPELKSGALVRVLPDWSGARSVSLSALYPSRQFLPVKVRLFIDFLAGLYGPVPYWEN